jgi:hypothetical protein
MYTKVYSENHFVYLNNALSSVYITTAKNIKYHIAIIMCQTALCHINFSTELDDVVVPGIIISTNQ